jgi:hypothetical protein
VELAPTRAELFVLDALPPGALACLQQIVKDEKPQPMLTLSYPADQSAIPQSGGLPCHSRVGRSSLRRSNMPSA